MKHYIDFHRDVSFEDLDYLLDTAIDLKAKTKAGIEHHLLKGKSLAMIFTKSSTRTRVSFEVGMYQLGGQALFLSNNDIQIGRGETIYDTANVLSGMVDGIMIRTFSHQDVEDLAKYGKVPVINGLTDDQHPTQVLADLLTIKEHKGELKGLKMAYLGDGNNMANSLLHACAKAGMDISVASPKDYTCPDKYVNEAKEDAKVTGSKIVMTEDPFEAAEGADVIYTDTWTSRKPKRPRELRSSRTIRLTPSLWALPTRMQSSCIASLLTEVMKLLKMLLTDLRALFSMRLRTDSTLTRLSL